MPANIYGIGMTGTGGTPYGVGSFASQPHQTTDPRRLTELMESSLLSPEEFLGLPEYVRRSFGNYRNYASAWQMRKQGFAGNESAYLAASRGESVIPADQMQAAKQARGGGRAVGSVQAKPSVAVGMGGERMRIPETATGRDMSGELKFRIPEEKTAYLQSEALRKYDEAQFVPRLRQKAMEEKTAYLQSEALRKYNEAQFIPRLRQKAMEEKKAESVAKRELETELRTADKDINATIDRLLKSKDLKEVAEGRRLKTEQDKLKEADKRREFTLDRDESKRNHDIDKLVKLGILRSSEIDSRFSNAKALIALRQDNAMNIYHQRRDDMRELAGYRMTEKWANTEAKYRLDLLDAATRISIQDGRAMEKRGVLYDNNDIRSEGVRMVNEAMATSASEHARIMTELERQIKDIKAGLTGPRFDATPAPAPSGPWEAYK